MKWKDFEKNIKEYGKIVNKPTKPVPFVVHLKNKLETACKDADLAFNGKVNAKIKNGKVYLEKVAAQPLPKNFDAIEELIDEKLKKVTLLDIIAHVAKSLRFEDIIKPISGYDPKLSDLLEHIIATLFCYGCNIEATEAAKSIRNISRKQINWIDTGYITEEVLDKCNCLVIDYYNKFRLPKFWGTGDHVSVDGSLWEMYQKNLMARFSARHGKVGGMGYYHVSDTYIALFSNFISCGVYEALYIIEGILKNESKIQPTKVHGDTHAQSLPIFALMYLLGIKLMPRIKGIKKLKFYKVKKEHTYINLDDLLTETIDWKLIETHVKDMYRIAMSIKEGKINAQVVIEKICAKEPKNKIYYAFSELGKVIRTCFLLEYICDFDLRKVVHASTCKSEEFNEYRDWIAFISDVIKRNDRAKQRKFIKYNQLVTNMVSLYNVQDMSDAISELRRQGNDIPDSILQRLNPYRKKNITRIGALDLNMNRIQKLLRPINCEVDIGYTG
jgi:TnpA family transposase